MVRNSGGNKAKKFASKSFNISNKTTRFAMEINEIYAIVQRMLGGNMCEVLCIDGSIKQCVIRGKFSGRGKRDNKLARGIWILVGIRDWQITTKEKAKCDLLEVYSEGDKEKLIKNSKESFRVFLSLSNDDGNPDHDQIKFINDTDEELYEELYDEPVLEVTSPNVDDIDGSSEGDDGEWYVEEDNMENNERSKERNDKNHVDLTNQLRWINIDDI
jgi:translation initiation factor IF-1